MEPYPYSPKRSGASYWGSCRVQLEGTTSLDGDMSNSISDDMACSFSGLMNFDPYAGLYNSPSITDQVFNNGLPSSYPSTPGFNLEENNSSQFFRTEMNGYFNTKQGSPGYGEKIAFQQMDTLLGFFDGTDDTHSLSSMQKINGSSQHLDAIGSYIMSKPASLSLDERMLKALSVFKESAGGGILAQVWVPIKDGDQFFLTTSEQPYLLDQILAGYREVSRTYTFSTEGKPGSLPGLPGRVFMSKTPEWTSNIGYYNKNEYLRMDDAINHEVRGSIGLPISDLHSELPCCAVLELVTTNEKPDFEKEMDIVCHALQNVDLTANMPPRLLPQCLSNSKRAALTAIVDVLRSVCHAHRLPIALTWIPCCVAEDAEGKDTKIHIKEGHSSPREKNILCVEESACYVTDKAMEGFVHACIEHHLQEGKGIAGRAHQSNHPFFCPDVKAYNISEYPLVHHARKYNLNAAVAIRLRSTYTNDDDYILEFFLPVNMKGSSEQQLLLDNLSGTMQKVCRNLRTVSDEELSRMKGSHVEFKNKNVPRIFPMSRRNSQIPLTNSNHDSVRKMSIKASNQGNNGIESSHNQERNGSRRMVETKRPAEKKVSLSVLQQHFSGTLKDAARSIGVCPTTLKRICRKQGISRWPSRKIKKVNRSLKKIQTVLDTVEGLEGGLKFDPCIGALVSREGESIIQEIDAHDTLLHPENVTAKEKWVLNKGGSREDKSKHSSILVNRDDDGAVEHNHPSSSGFTNSSNDSGSNQRQNLKGKSTFADKTGLKLQAKATYGEDTVRFKFDPSWGCLKLYEEVATRFKLQNGSFQLKYLDNEQELVRLLDDSDLQECIEILDEVGKSCVRFVVRDIPCNLSSSSCSSCYLGCDS
ncbi:protein NLP2-like [Arachis stenosperma]|uniref:protein NLP2-like n=1 Tax=Arachis stenosperma TaxID=217475 RepID=UPI0025AC1359|nr:protein NLP2-like [Arachis stenosperma]XP_057728301.1 protein NLP2-like [Arachis stenosperma]XP_057728302.1 protein NLP2-like [Arachis stenosperma]XP_057728303.1 protein NLP2-like [Arachis stenosperma]XP_057728304.1 protein NLP2-like [Arachis stenosperma]XP_057728305.1 protein NLP2-like [Arachis stenosperma]